MKFQVLDDGVALFVGELAGEQTVTVSIGYACQVAGQLESSEKLFEAADAASRLCKRMPSEGPY